MRSKNELKSIAYEKAEQILEQWWTECSSWDNIMEEYQLTDEEIEQIDDLRVDFDIIDPKESKL